MEVQSKNGQLNISIKIEMKKLILSSILCFLVISCLPTPSESGIHKFLDAFYNKSIDESLVYVDENTRQWLRKYYFSSPYKSVCNISNFKCSQKYSYQVIAKKEKNRLAYFDVLFKEDTLKNMIIQKEKQPFLVKLDEHQLIQLLANEKAVYTDILCIIEHNFESFNEDNKINDARVWFNDSFYKKFEDSYINYLYGSFFEKMAFLEESKIKINEYASKSIQYYHKAYHQDFSGKDIFPESNLGILRRLSLLYNVTNQNNTFELFCEQEAKKGKVEAISMLGEIYLNDYYSTRNLKSIDKAIILFEEAAQKENKAAIINLYNIYKGIKKDPEKAAYWKSKIQY